MKKFYCKDKVIQNQILFDIYFNYSCNFNCYYCYSKKINKEMSFENLKKLISFFKKDFNGLIPTTKILGGEPLLYKYLFDFIDSLIDKITIDLTTNFSLINDKIIKKINSYKNYKNNFNLEFSIHPMYITKYKDKLFKIISKLDIPVTLIINLDINYKRIIEDFIKNLPQFDNVKKVYNPIMASKNKNKYEDFNIIDFDETFKDQIYIFDNKEYQFLDMYKIFKRKYKFNFKDKVFCNQRYFIIEPDLKIIQQCSKKIFSFNDFNKKDFYIKCPSSFCDYSCFFDLNKIFLK